MTCHGVQLPGGQSAIVCTGRRAKRKCCGCGRVAGLLCDWKVPGKRSGTCDRPICQRCSVHPAPDKDLCPKHAREWAERQAARG